VLRLVLRAVIGEERQDAYALLRHTAPFSLVCKLWRDAAASTPLHVNVDYMQAGSWWQWWFQWMLLVMLAQ